MKSPSMRIVVAVIVLAAGWGCGQAFWRRSDDSGDTQHQPVRVTLLNNRNPSADLLIVDKDIELSTAWLNGVVTRLKRANAIQVKRWRRQAENWSFMVRQLVSPLILAREAELDPAVPRSIPRRIGSQELARILAGEDPQRLGDWSGIQNGSHILERLAAGDFAGVLESLDASVLESVCNALGKTRPEEAIDWIGQLKSHRRRQMAYESLVSGWGSEDPTAAMEWLESRSPGRDRSGMGRELLQALGLSDPHLGLENIDRLLDIGVEYERQPAQFLFRKWMAQDPGLALAWAEESEDADVFLAVAVQELARTDLERAVRLYGQLEADAYGRTASTIVSAWLAKDPEAAGAWARGIEDAELRTRAMLEIADYWVERDPDTAIQWGMALDQERLASETFKGRTASFLEKLERTQPGRLFDEPVLGNLLRNQEVLRISPLFSLFSESDPEAAAALLATMPDPEDRGMIGVIVANWARDDPAAAAGWIEALPEGDARLFASEQLVRAWADIDAASAESWAHHVYGNLNELGLEPFADALSTAYHYAGDFSKALSYADQVSDANRRGQLLAGLFGAWVDVDRSGAIEAFRQTDLSELALEHRERIQGEVFLGVLEH